MRAAFAGRESAARRQRCAGANGRAGNRRRKRADDRSAYVNGTTAPAPTANSQGLSTIAGVPMPMPMAPTMAAPVATLAFNTGVNLTRDVQLTFDAANVTNIKRAYYRYGAEERQKRHVVGRRYDLNLV